MMTDINKCMQVDRGDLSKVRFVEMPDPMGLQLNDEVVLHIEKFALTANNITYGVAGDMLGYWKFFPADMPWGEIPVWGIGKVIKSAHPGVKEGDRYYGYFPMASYLIIQPEKVNNRGLVDASVHRSELPPVYNQYMLMTEDNGFSPVHDDHQMIYRPLFMTAFLIDDFLEDNDFFGAETFLLTSASSKTAIGLASLLHKRQGFRVTGLTSARNKGFVESLGIYSSVHTYDEMESELAAHEKVVLVDMAGNRPLLARLHHHFRDNMVYSCGVGITHWEDRDGEDPASLPGAKPAMFFAPSQVQKRIQDWGQELYQQKLSAAWDEFLGQVDTWITINRADGRVELERVYGVILKGGTIASEAWVISPD